MVSVPMIYKLYSPPCLCLCQTTEGGREHSRPAHWSYLTLLSQHSPANSSETSAGEVQASCRLPGLRTVQW